MAINQAIALYEPIQLLAAAGSSQKTFWRDVYTVLYFKPKGQTIWFLRGGGGGGWKIQTVQVYVSAQGNKTDIFSCKSAAQDIFSQYISGQDIFFCLS